jgi:osmoprotectant transport system substrate-binding protein
VAAGVLALAACTSASHADQRGAPQTLHDGTITVGSFDFAESELLSELYSQALERGGYRVERAFDLGPREFVAPALDRGLVEFVPEYAGTAAQFFSVGSVTPGVTPARAHDALVRSLAGHRLVALASAPAQDANAFGVTRGTAARFGLRTLSDLARAAPHLVFGGPPECASRPLCLLGLERGYGARFEAVVTTLDAGGPLTRQALREGEIDVGLLFTSDPAVGGDGLVELTDDRALQPADNVTPIVRTEVAERWGPTLVARVDDVSARLTTGALRELNAQVMAGRTSRAVATAWLDAQGLR